MDLIYKRFTQEHIPLWIKYLLEDTRVMKYVYDYDTGVNKIPYYLNHWEKHGKRLGLCDLGTAM